MISSAKKQKELSRLQKRVFRALLLRAAPPDGQMGASATIDDSEQFLEKFVMGGPPEMKLGLYLAVWVFEHLTFLMAFTWGRFSRQSPERQDRTIRAYQHSRFYLKRAIIKVLLSFCLVAYYSRPEVFAGLGYRLEPLLAKGVYRR